MWIFKPSVNDLVARGDIRGVVKALAYDEEHAYNALAFSFESAAVPYLVAALADKTIGRKSARVLRSITASAEVEFGPGWGINLAMPHLIRALHDPNDTVRLLAEDEIRHRFSKYDDAYNTSASRLIDALKDQGNPTPVLAVCLQSENHWLLRKKVVPILGGFALDPSAVLPLTEALLKEKESQVSVSMPINGSFELEPSAIEPLTDALLKEKDESVYSHVCQTLGSLRSLGPVPGAVRALTQALKREDGDRARWAAQALRSYGEEAWEAIPFVIEALEKAIVDRGDYFETLISITGQSLGPDSTTWRDWWSAAGEKTAIVEPNRCDTQ